MESRTETVLTVVVTEPRFEKLVRENHRSVRTYARSIANDESIVDDAVQETFIRAWRHLDSFRGEGSFEGWLIRICRHCVIDIERREGRSRQLADANSRVVGRDASGPPDESGDLISVLQTLTRSHREVLTVCGVLGYDYESASLILDVPLGTVRSRLHRARQALAAELEASESGAA